MLDRGWEGPSQRPHRHHRNSLWMILEQTHCLAQPFLQGYELNGRKERYKSNINNHGMVKWREEILQTDVNLFNLH